MSPAPRFPALYQINTRVWLGQLAVQAGRPIGLAEVPDEELDALAEMGFDWVWLLSVWETGAAGRTISQSSSRWRQEFEHALPDLTDDDICGSGFAIKDYQVSTSLGGAEGLADFRARLAARGVRLMLDFVPNHTALDHRWVQERPEFYVIGTADDLETRPGSFAQIETSRGKLALAHGRDPNFSGWVDTLQLNYGNPDVQTAMIAELAGIAQQCDGVRCDMAMLVLPDVFRRTWGVEANPFWPAAIDATRRASPDFMFLAEVYWDLEWELQQQGFDFCYDKRLYDRLTNGNPAGVRDHLAADIAYQGHLVRFLENHDEERAASRFPLEMHKAAAVLAYLAPGLRLFHQGQLAGAMVRIPPRLCRGPAEQGNSAVVAFYLALLAVLSLDVLRIGSWQQLQPEPAWDGNPSHQNFVAGLWTDASGRRVLVIVNFSFDASQCRIPCPALHSVEGDLLLTGLLGQDVYRRSKLELSAGGLYVALEPWRFHVFDITGDPPQAGNAPR